eukprot:Seg413.6 transcript_id=Seg413.6/GoldUCD/mRNA.D3Y31 product="Kelch-like protein diablo" protein_id=Seg413.6/GoldUCD/D3Y31
MSDTEDIDFEDWDDILCAEPEREFSKTGKAGGATAGLANDGEEEGWDDVIAIEVQEGYCGQLMKQMEVFRKQNILCDAKIAVDDEELPVHKSILSASSQFFNDIFSRITGEDDNKITLKNLHGRAMDDILHFIYTGEACIHDDNVRQLVATANFLKLEGLKEMAVAYLERKLNPTNAVEILMLAKKHDCTSLIEACETLICENFVMVSQTEGFRKCSLEVLLEFIQSEDLKVLKEEEVYEAVMHWVRFNSYDGEKNLVKILQCVRMPLMSPFYLAENVEKDMLIQRNNGCLDLVLEARNYHLPSTDRTQYNSTRTRPRRFMGVVWGIVSVGGWQQTTPTRDVYAFIPSTGKWHPLSPIFSSRYNHAVVSCDGFIYVIGGRDDATRLDASVLRFDTSANRWSYVSSLPYPMAALGAVAFDGQMYTIGGLSGIGSVNLVFKYSTRKDTWQTVAPLNMPRGGVAVVSDEKNIYAMGGIHKTGNGISSSWKYLDSMEVYSKEQNTWRISTPLLSPRAYASAAYLNRRIFLVGGQGEMLGICKGFDVYNMDMDEWNSYPYHGIPRSMSGITINDTKFYVVGGMSKDGDSVNTVETYDISRDRWTKITSLPMAISATQCCTVQLRLAVLQGMTTSMSE